MKGFYAVYLYCISGWPFMPLNMVTNLDARLRNLKTVALRVIWIGTLIWWLWDRAMSGGAQSETT